MRTSGSTRFTAIYLLLPTPVLSRSKPDFRRPWQKTGRDTKGWEESAKIASRQPAVARQGGVRKKTYQARVTVLCKSYLDDNATAPWNSGASTCHLKEDLRNVISKLPHELPGAQEARTKGEAAVSKTAAQERDGEVSLVRYIIPQI